MKYLVFLMVVAGAGLVLRRLGLWAEKKGWIYYHKEKRGSALGNVMQVLDPIWNPAGKHRQFEERRLQDDRNREQDGAPPEMPPRWPVRR